MEAMAKERATQKALDRRGDDRYGGSRRAAPSSLGNRFGSGESKSRQSRVDADGWSQKMPRSKRIAASGAADETSVCRCQ